MGWNKQPGVLTGRARGGNRNNNNNNNERVYQVRQTKGTATGEVKQEMNDGEKKK